MNVLSVELKRLEDIQQDTEIWNKFDVNERNLRLTAMNATSTLIGVLMLMVNSWRDIDAAQKESKEESKKNG